MGGEFDLIARYFAPLAAATPGAFGLGDDAALVDGLVVTKDLLVEGVHFRAKDDRADVAKKALRVNASDLAAKGAKPSHYALGLVWPSGVKEEAVAAFARGLSEDQEALRLCLIGGDTTVHRDKAAPFTISVTMFGQPAKGGLIRRNGAQPGDDVYVSGAIGDAFLGLAALDGAAKFTPARKAYLAERYLTPSPRVSLGGALAGVATAAIDISDGLIADARHVAAQSGVCLKIALADMPLSAPARHWLEAQDDADAALAALASGGDDYEILFTAPPARRRSIEMAAQVTKTPVARIGAVARGEGVALTGAKGLAVEAPRGGWDHFRD